MGYNLTDVVKHLIFINIVFFLVTNLLMPSAMIPYNRTALALYFPWSSGFQPFQIVTHMFMHAGVGHIFFNMLGLFFFGPALEARWGPKRFLFFYLAAGLFAALIHSGSSYYEYLQLYREILQTDGMSLEKASQLAKAQILPAVGASGAVYGVLAAYAMLFTNEKVMLLIPPIPVKAGILVLILVTYDYFSGISGHGTGIANFAHLGGAFFGVIMVAYWIKIGRGYS